MATLICTLGGSWAVVPEVLGYLEPEVFKIYPVPWFKRNRHNTQGITDVWCITTCGARAVSATESLSLYWRQLPDKAPSLSIFRPSGVEDISTIDSNRIMEELIHRLALTASSRGPLYWSLAGGRKTMSSLMQKAAGIYGATDLLHVLSSEDVDRATASAASIPLLLDGFSEQLALGVEVVSLGPSGPFEGITWHHVAGYSEILPEDYPLEGTTDGACTTVCISGRYLCTEIERRQQEAAQVSRNYFFELLKADQRDNFRSLYRLPSSDIERLRSEKIGSCPDNEASDLSWLHRLPKAELHCHLGGVALPWELHDIASAVFAGHGTKLSGAANVLQSIGISADSFQINKDTLLSCKMLQEVKKALRTAEDAGVPRDLATAAVILSLPLSLLDLLCSVEVDRDLVTGIGLETYRNAGDMQGSSLLRTPEAIEAVCRLLYRKARTCNVKYLEVRGSPENCSTATFDGRMVLQAIRNSFLRCMQEDAGCQVELILIGTRHGNMDRFYQHTQLAVWGADEWLESPRVVGFDLAGEESTRSPQELRELFAPLFQRCIKLTIHAGETEPAENVWGAVYHLNADRIGHGLKLIDHVNLLCHVRDRGTALELCPTSNDQIVGFRDHCRGDALFKEYPLKMFLDHGLRVAICTDNPGISRTDWDRELLKAARLTSGGLSKWDILGIIRTSFQAAFLPQPERARLLKIADEEVFRTISN